MSLSRFEQLLRFIQFDNKSTRSERRKTDKLCPICDVWEKVTANVKKYYDPSENLTVDEHSVPMLLQLHPVYAKETRQIRHQDILDL